MEDELTRALGAAGGTAASEASARAARRLAAGADREGLVDVAYAMVDSPLGPLVAAGTADGLVMLRYADEGVDEALERIAARVSPRIMELPARLDPARRELDEYFAGARREFGIP